MLKELQNTMDDVILTDARSSEKEKPEPRTKTPNFGKLHPLKIMKKWTFFALLRGLSACVASKYEVRFVCLSSLFPRGIGTRTLRTYAMRWGSP
jgi:hypothetical protein